MGKYGEIGGKSGLTFLKHEFHKEIPSLMYRRRHPRASPWEPMGRQGEEAGRINQPIRPAVPGIPRVPGGPRGKVRENMGKYGENRGK